jgi:hypothetical protein
MGQHMTGDIKVEQIKIERRLDEGKEEIELVKNLKAINT